MNDDHVSRRRWTTGLSVRVRLTIAAAVVISIGMAVAASLLLWRMYSVLAADLDNSLIQQTHAAAEDVAGGTSALRVSRTAAASTAIQVVDGGGRVIASAGDVDGNDQLFHTTPTAGEPRLATVGGPMLEGAYRVAAMTVPTRSGGVTLYVGSPIAPLATFRSELGSSLAIGIPAAVVSLTWVSWWLIGRALRPVETMRRQASAISGHDLDRRLDVPAAGDELGRLAETFNELLARITSASAQQRRFVDDAAHELRSPLAALRTRLEVHTRTTVPVGAEASDAAKSKMGYSTPGGELAEVIRLVDLVDDLLVIARLDAREERRHRTVDLDDVVWQTTADARRQGPPHIDTTGVSPVRVIGDASALRRVVQNLVDNARRHATRRVVVRLAMDPIGAVLGGNGADGPTATLSITDDGPGIPVADRARIFDRFVRLDEARGRDAGGTGLGLAIVSSVVAAHGGSVWADEGKGSVGATFSVRLSAVAPTVRE